MRRLTVLQLLPALESGGVERSTLEIGRALVEAGHRSVVVSAGGRLVPQLESEGSEHIWLELGRKRPWVLRHVYTLRRVLGALRPDIVHARSRLPAWIAHLALRKPGAVRPHFVTTAHGLNSPSRYSRIMARGERVICVSGCVRRYLLQHYPETDPARLAVIPRGIDPAEFPRGFETDSAWREALLAAHPQLRGGHLLLMPGRGTRLKGHAAAIALLTGLVAQGVDAKLWLPGALESGRERYLDELRALAQQSGMLPRIVISEPISAMREAYALADLVLQLSDKPEAFGRTVLEALSVGRPVLGWDHGGVGELLADLYPAGAVPLGDSPALLARARALIDAPPAPPAAIPYTLQTMQSATLALYAELAND